MDSIEKVSKNLIEEAYLTKASDIHIVPRERDAIIHFRVDHALLKKRDMKKEECVRLISHFKFLSAMDIGERRKPKAAKRFAYVKAERGKCSFKNVNAAHN